MDHSPSKRPVTLKDIAELCGVSGVTVSRALRNDLRNVSRATIDRVVATARELGYDPSVQHTARRLALSKYGQEIQNNVIGLFFPRRFQSIKFFLEIFLGILDSVEFAGFGLLTIYDEQAKVSLPSAFTRGDVDGLICILPKVAGNLNTLKRLGGVPAFSQRPVVSLLEPMEGCSSILVDDWRAGYLVTKHLLELGHRDIVHAFASDGPNYPHNQRLDAARQALAEYGIDPNKHLHQIKWCTDDYERSAQAHCRFMREHPEVTAIIAPNDYLGLRMREALDTMNLSVPDDVSIIGFDDLESMPDAQGNNIFTTVRIPLHTVGQEAARVVIDRVTGRLRHDETIILPVELIVRGSTARPRQR